MRTTRTVSLSVMIFISLMSLSRPIIGSDELVLVRPKQKVSIVTAESSRTDIAKTTVLEKEEKSSENDLANASEISKIKEAIATFGTTLGQEQVEDFAQQVMRPLLKIQPANDTTKKNSIQDIFSQEEYNLIKQFFIVRKQLQQVEEGFIKSDHCTLPSNKAAEAESLQPAPFIENIIARTLQFNSEYIKLMQELYPESANLEKRNDRLRWKNYITDDLGHTITFENPYYVRDKGEEKIQYPFSAQTNFQSLAKFLGFPSAELPKKSDFHEKGLFSGKKNLIILKKQPRKGQAPEQLEVSGYKGKQVIKSITCKIATLQELKEIKAKRDEAKKQEEEKRHLQAETKINPEKKKTPSVQINPLNLVDFSSENKTQTIAPIEAVTKINKVQIDLADKYGNTPLIDAVMKGAENTAISLLRAGANPNVVPNYQSNEAKGSLLACAIKKKEWGLADELLKHKVNLELKDKYANTPLIDAVMSGYEQSAIKLLMAGANPNVVPNYQSNEAKGSLLACAIKKKQWGLADELLKHKVNLELKDKYANTPLIDAVMSGYEQTAIKLLRAGANPNVIPNYANNQSKASLLSVAQSKHMWALVRELTK
ncbi:MAG: hypothetical protein HQK52_07060 [Oligoflexia bacterium]|nr:hypothetical protein [Oligoflexia bacterium]